MTCVVVFADGAIVARASPLPSGARSKSTELASRQAGDHRLTATSAIIRRPDEGIAAAMSHLAITTAYGPEHSVWPQDTGFRARSTMRRDILLSSRPAICSAGVGVIKNVRADNAGNEFRCTLWMKMACGETQARLWQ